MSIIEQTLSNLRLLKLSGMADTYSLQLDQPKLNAKSFDERFAMLVDYELTNRETRRIQRFIKMANFPERCSLEDLDDRPSRDLDKPLISTLATCEWIHRHQNLTIRGATGTGKTWLGSAIGTQACRLGIPTIYIRSTQLLSDIAIALADGSLANLKSRLIKPALLVIDDFGHGQINISVGHVLLDIIDQRMRSGSLLFTTQYPFEQWHDLFPDPTLADAILDRVVHQSHVLHLKGESMRKLRAKKKLTGQ